MLGYILTVLAEWWLTIFAFGNKIFCSLHCNRKGKLIIMREIKRNNHRTIPQHSHVHLWIHLTNGREAEDERKENAVACLWGTLLQMGLMSRYTSTSPSLSGKAQLTHYGKGGGGGCFSDRYWTALIPKSHPKFVAVHSLSYPSKHCPADKVVWLHSDSTRISKLISVLK